MDISKDINKCFFFQDNSVVAPPPVNDTGTIPNLPESYRMSKISGIRTSNIPKIFIDDLLSSSSRTFSSKMNFDEIDRQNFLTNRLPAFSVQPLESIARPIWSGQVQVQNRRQPFQPPPRFRPNRYDQSLIGWRQNKPRFDNPEVQQGFPPPPHRQRSFRFNPHPQGHGPKFRNPHFQQRQEQTHPLENFDSFETFETSPPPPPPPSPHQGRYAEQQQQQDDYTDQGQQPQEDYTGQIQPSQDDYVDQRQPPQEDIEEQQVPVYSRPTQPPSSVGQPQLPVRYVDVVNHPPVTEVKTGVDGNRGVKTRVYTRITDVTTVGGDGETENDDKHEQRQDEPNQISNIIDQAINWQFFKSCCFDFFFQPAT